MPAIWYFRLLDSIWSQEKTSNFADTYFIYIYILLEHKTQPCVLGFWASQELQQGDNQSIGQKREKCEHRDYKTASSGGKHHHIQWDNQKPCFRPKWIIISLVTNCSDIAFAYIIPYITKNPSITKPTWYPKKSPYPNKSFLRLKTSTTCGPHYKIIKDWDFHSSNDAKA